MIYLKSYVFEVFFTLGSAIDAAHSNAVIRA